VNDHVESAAPNGPEPSWFNARVVQSLSVDASVLLRISQYRQTRARDREAGGQLFGSVSATRVTISRATGPYETDHRSRCSYRSDPTEAQRAIDAMAKEGLIFLGEWHTHAEPIPRASTADVSTMEQIRRNSKTNTSTLFLIIVGNATGANGVSVYSVSETGLELWQIFA